MYIYIYIYIVIDMTGAVRGGTCRTRLAALLPVLPAA